VRPRQAIPEDNPYAASAKIRRARELAPGHLRAMSMRDRTAWLKGGDAICGGPPPNVGRAWRVVLLGPPGIGKNVQAERLHYALGACPLATGELFRAAAENRIKGDRALTAVAAHMTLGQAVPDHVVLALVRDRRKCLSCRGGFLLNGFPRTLAQAQALDALLEVERLQLDAVLNYEADERVLLTRLGGRRVCAHCQAAFHLVAAPPRIPDVCDRCGGVLLQERDDQPQAVTARLHAYASTIAPLVEYYRGRGLLISICANGTPTEIFARTLDALVDATRR
jgi:adenylate kinase